MLITEVEVARHERDILSERLDDLMCNTIHTKKGQKFMDGVRQCCLELLAMNVATNQAVISDQLRYHAYDLLVALFEFCQTLAGNAVRHSDLPCLVAGDTESLEKNHLIRNQRF